MKTLLFKFLLCLALVFANGLAFSQTSSTVYGLYRDANGIKLAEMNTGSGNITNISSSYIGQIISATGACLNPYTNTFHFFRQNGISSVDLNNGQLVHNPSLNNPDGASYFDLPQFNNSDASIYGIARRSYTDPINGGPSGELFLSRINPVNGQITQISPSSIGTMVSLNGGSVVDPYQMVYYFHDRDYFLGVDMYTGNILSQSTPTFAKGNHFDLPAFHCADSTIYGLIRYNHFDTVWLGGTYHLMLNPDSSMVFLGSIEPGSGAVTQISPASLAKEISLNASSTIDPLTGTFYFQNATHIIGVDLTTGLTTSSQVKPGGGAYFDIMRNFQNCYYAEAVRTSSNNQLAPLTLDLHPNPTNGVLHFSSTEIIEEAVLTDLSGKVVMRKQLSSSNGELDLSSLAKGMYLIQITTDQQSRSIERIVVE